MDPFYDEEEEGNGPFIVLVWRLDGRALQAHATREPLLARGLSFLRHLGHSRTTSHAELAVPRTEIRDRVNSQLRDLGLTVTAVYDELFKRQGREVAVDLVKAPPALLKAEAEGARIIKQMKDSRWSVYASGLSSSFPGEALDASFFTSGEKIRITCYVMNKLKTEADQNRSLLPILERQGVIAQLFPLHDAEEKNKLMGADHWLLKRLGDGRLGQVTDYVGSEIGFYVAFTTFLCKWLVVPAVLGIVVYVWSRINVAEEVSMGTDSAVGALSSFSFFSLLTSATPAPVDVHASAAALARATTKYAMDRYAVLYSWFLMLWASAFAEFWKRRSAALAYEWHVHDYSQQELIQEPRPEFYGEERTSPVTRQKETWYSSRRRNAKLYGVSLPLTLFLMACTIYGMLLYHRLKNSAAALWIKTYHSTGSSHEETTEAYSAEAMTSLPLLQRLGFWVYGLLLKHIPTLLYSAAIVVCDRLYRSLAVRLTDWENYRTHTAYRNALMLKLVLFRLANSFVPLGYVAFISPDLPDLQRQLVSRMLVMQLLRQSKELILPKVKRRFMLNSALRRATQRMSMEDMSSPINTDRSDRRQRSMSLDQCVTDTGGEHTLRERKRRPSLTPKTTPVSKGVSAVATPGSSGPGEVDGGESSEAAGYVPLRPYEVEAHMSNFPGTFPHFCESVTEFGYVVCFGWVWPLLPLCVFVATYVESRSTVFNLMTSLQRPLFFQAGDIGSWLQVMESISFMAVFLNTLALLTHLLVVPHESLPSTDIYHVFASLSAVERVLCVVALEHVLLLSKVLLKMVVPDVPHKVATAMARDVYDSEQQLEKQTEELTRLTTEHAQFSSSVRRVSRNRVKTLSLRTLVTMVQQQKQASRDIQEEEDTAEQDGKEASEPPTRG